MKLKPALLAGLGALGLLVASGYYYVYLAGAPQLDAQVVPVDPHLHVQLESFDSQAMGATRQYSVILPPGYAQHSHQRYPVIFLLHGGHDDAMSFADKYAVAPILDQLYSSGKLPPSVVIMPDGNDDRGSNPITDPAYFDGPHGKLDTLIGSELVNLVKQRYRVADDPRLWAMGGISSGGWGAFNIGLRHLDKFHVLFSHSGYFTDNSGPANSPTQFVGQLPPAQLKNLRAYLDAGESDAEFVASSREFHQTLNKLQVVNQFNLFPGGHGLTGADYGWNYFRKHLVDSLSYVGTQFKQVPLAQLPQSPQHGHPK